MPNNQSIKEIIFDIHRRKNGYLFGNRIENIECSFKEEPDQKCTYSEESGCPYYFKENSKYSDINPMRFAHCYFNENEKFLDFLENNGFVVTAPLFRIHNIENGKIRYYDQFWYPFRTSSAYADLPINNLTLQDNLRHNNNEEVESLNQLRWNITTQRNAIESDNKIPFSLFKKVEKTKYRKDKEVKYIDVCDGYATFIMMYFILSRRNKAVKLLDGDSNIEKNYDGKFAKELNWEFSLNNEHLNEYIKKKKENILRLSIKGNKVYRKSTWDQDLKLLGLIDENNNPTEKFYLFKTWINKPIESSDEKIRSYRKNFRKAISFLPDNKLRIDYNWKIQYASTEMQSFILYPPIHLIVRAFWVSPVRWFFIPMTPKFYEDSIICTSGLILMTSDERNTTAYYPDRNNNAILEKVTNLLPILTSIYSIEIQSLEDYLNKERVELHEKQRQASLRSGIAKVFLRTLSHNIGSHVLSRLIQSEDLDLSPLLETSKVHSKASHSEQYRGLIKNSSTERTTIYQEINKEFKNNNEISIQDIQRKLYKKYVSIFNSYIKTRMEFLADFVTGAPQLQVTKSLFNEVIKPFDDNRILLNRISGLSKDFKFTLNVETINCREDFRVSISNDVLGQHALYIILENIIRNTAKHSPKGLSDEVEFTLLIRESTIDKSFYKIIIYDNVKRNKTKLYSPRFLIEKYKDVKMKKWLNSFYDNKLSSDITITETQKIAGELNVLIDSDIIRSDNFELRQQGMGMIEMLVSAAYLRRIPAENVQDEDYKLKFSNSEIDEYKTKTGRGEKPLNIFRAVTHQDEYLGFEFYIPKPKDILFIDKKNDILPELTSEEFNKLRNRGILIIHEPSKVSYGYDLCVINDESVSQYANNLLLPSRKILWTDVQELFREYGSLKNSLLEIHDIKFTKEIWRAYVSKYFMKKSLKAHRNDLVKNQNFTEYDFEFFDHGESYSGTDLTIYLEIYGSEHKRLISRILSNFESQSTDIISNESDILLFKFLNSTITNIIVLDERIQNLSEATLPLRKNNKYPRISYQEFWNNVNVYIPDAEKDIDLNAKNYGFDWTERIREIIKSQFVHHNERVPKKCDFIVIHLGVIEKLLLNESVSKSKTAINIANKIEEIKRDFEEAKVIVTSGRGQPKNLLPPNIPFVSYSILSQYLIEKRFKLNLSELLYAAKPLSYE